MSKTLYFYGGTLTTNRQPYEVSVVCPLGLLVNNFMLDRTTSSSARYFSVSFGGSIVTIKACPHWCFKLDWCGLNLDQSCPHLIHIARKWIVSGSKLDWANPRTVGGLDLDRKWIITGNEVFTWQAHSLIEARVVENVERSLERTRNEHIVVFTGSRQCPKPAWWDIRKRRLHVCTSELQVCYDMTIIGPCVQIVIS